MTGIKRVVYIPSRQRPKNVAKVIPRWLNQHYSVNVVVEERDIEGYTKLFLANEFPNTKVKIIKLPEADKGVGFARSWIVAHAHGRFPSFIMADDDVMPRVVPNNGNDGWRDHMVRLQQAVERNERIGLVGCAAVHSYQDFLLQGFLKKELGNPKVDGAIGRPCLARNGSFGQCYAINTERAVDIGGFDVRLSVAYEDNDFMMRSISKQYPWSFHSGVWMDRLGGRFESGGIADLTGMPDKGADSKNGRDLQIMASDLYKKKFEECRLVMAKKWPDYTSDPYKKQFRISWKKLYDGMIPSWQSLAATHGGSIQ